MGNKNSRGKAAAINLIRIVLLMLLLLFLSVPLLPG